MSADHKQQEPVAWMNSKRDMSYLYGPYHDDDIPLYTSPQPSQQSCYCPECERMSKELTELRAERTWVGLTDEEIEYCDTHSHGNTERMKKKMLAKSIEAKLKAKNTPKEKNSD